MDEDRATTTRYITITDAAKIKDCTRKVIYNHIKRGDITTEIVLGRRAVVNDEKFQQLKIKKGNWKALVETSKSIAALRKEIDRLEERVEKLEAERQG